MQKETALIQQKLMPPRFAAMQDQEVVCGRQEHILVVDEEAPERDVLLYML